MTTDEKLSALLIRIKKLEKKNKKALSIAKKARKVSLDIPCKHTNKNNDENSNAYEWDDNEDSYPIWFISKFF